MGFSQTAFIAYGIEAPDDRLTPAQLARRLKADLPGLKTRLSAPEVDWLQAGDYDQDWTF
ncbi:hypothetical protein G3I76_75025, partial [Streptomyces sp. SID11233]|nr:hypothetical protein [Streptomyces sp. SID11233]